MMLSKGSRILLREDGTECLVEQLTIGTTVFNPLSRKYFKVEDILSRQVDYSLCRSHPLLPIVIEASEIDVGRPRHRVLVSPSQAIFACERQSEESTYAVASVRTASSLFPRAHDNEAAQEFSKYITYYAVFSKQRQFLDVSGLLMQTYDFSVYEKSHNKFSQKYVN